MRPANPVRALSMLLVLLSGIEQQLIRVTSVVLTTCKAMKFAADTYP